VRLPQLPYGCCWSTYGCCTLLCPLCTLLHVLRQARSPCSVSARLNFHFIRLPLPPYLSAFSRTTTCRLNMAGTHPSASLAITYEKTASILMHATALPAIQRTIQEANHNPPLDAATNKVAVQELQWWLEQGLFAVVGEGFHVLPNFNKEVCSQAIRQYRRSTELA
jgi:hypothetical protein